LLDIPENGGQHLAAERMVHEDMRYVVGKRKRRSVSGDELDILAAEFPADTANVVCRYSIQLRCDLNPDHLAERVCCRNN
jgi:hypothetical protein